MTEDKEQKGEWAIPRLKCIALHDDTITCLSSRNLKGTCFFGNCPLHPIKVSTTTQPDTTAEIKALRFSISKFQEKEKELNDEIFVLKEFVKTRDGVIEGLKADTAAVYIPTNGMPSEYLRAEASVGSLVPTLDNDKTEFKVDDKVVCIDESGREDWLKEGERYTVDRVYEEEITIKELGQNHGFLKQRFKVVSPTTPPSSTSATAPQQPSNSELIKKIQERIKELKAIEYSDGTAWTRKDELTWVLQQIQGVE